MDAEQHDLARWIGRSVTSTDVATVLVAARMAGLLDREPPAVGASWPATWIWALFWPALRHDATGPDGHAARGSFLPPVALPLRMWGGSEISIGRPIRVGEAVTRVSTISDITQKSGRSGALCFVKIEHRIIGADGGAMTEIQTLAYREAAKADGVAAQRGSGVDFAVEWRRTITPDAVLLFQYSAVTYNTHRIHYDHPYATVEEGYPGLVVHGPLTATMLMELVGRHRPDARVANFSVSARRPIYATAPFEVVGRADKDTFELAALDQHDHVGMAIKGNFAE